LRERREDIPLLLQHYAGVYAQKYNLSAKRFSAGVLEQLIAYGWPGNVRALRHAVERAVILSEGELLSEADFPLIGAREQEASQASSRLDDIEKAAIVRALETHKNNVSRAARALGLTRTSLYRRMERYGL
jgi:DNA-binding NtrC family response regulator